MLPNPRLVTAERDGYFDSLLAPHKKRDLGNSKVSGRHRKQHVQPATRWEEQISLWLRPFVLLVGFHPFSLQFERHFRHSRKTRNT